jgi:hypothetical protein
MLVMPPHWRAPTVRKPRPRPLGLSWSSSTRVGIPRR